MEPTPRVEDHGPGLWAQLRRGWPLIVIAAVVAAAAAYLLASAREQTFTASTALLVSQSSPEATILGADVPQDSGTQGRSTATIAAVANARPVAERTAAALRGRLSAAEVHDRVVVAPSADANVLHVSATDSTAKGAAELANAFARAVVAAQSERIQRNARSAREALQRRYSDLPASTRRSAAGQDLRVQVQRLRTLELVGSRGLSVVEPAEPPEQGNSSVSRDTLLGALFGVLLGAGLALLLQQRDRRLRPEEDLERMLGVPVLGQIPHSRNLARAVPMRHLAPAEAEAFRMLWTRLRYGPFERPVRRVLVTSAAPQEGKSLVAWYLACAAADSGARVLLVEADARRPALSERHGLATEPGLLGLLQDNVPLPDAVSHVDAPSPGALDVLTARGAGSTLTGLHTMRRLVELLGNDVAEYELVVVDAPPLPLAAEATPLSTAVDGVLVVSRVGHSTRDGLLDVLGELRRLRAPTLGVVRDGAQVSGGYVYAEPAAASA
jgi:succinoglycan biosynthesis transport protein ExoP